MGKICELGFGGPIAIGCLVGILGCSVGTSDGASGSFGLGDDTANVSVSAGTLDPDVPDDDGGGGSAGTGAGDDGMAGTSSPAGSDDADGPGDDTAADDSTMPGECGNGAVEGSEQCDARDLDGAACADFGHSDGALVCGMDCQLITDGCSTCGDGEIALTETCDGADFGGATCASMGFAGGALSCSADCQTIVTSGCQPLPSCGDGVLNGGEQCDAAALGGHTCISQGFDLGQLACSASCTLDTSGCSFDTKNCGGEGDFCLFDKNDLQSTCCPPGVQGNVLGICNIAICV